MITITILNKLPDLEDQDAWRVYILIDDETDAYQYCVTGVPIGAPDIQAYLDAQAADIWIAAAARGDNGDVFDMDAFQNRVFKAFVLASRDRDETLVQAINDLADFAGVPPGAPARPEPLTIAQIKTAIRNRLPDV